MDLGAGHDLCHFSLDTLSPLSYSHTSLSVHLPLSLVLKEMGVYLDTTPKHINVNFHGDLAGLGSKFK